MRRAAALLLLALACSTRLAAQASPCRLTGPGDVRELRLGVVCYGGVSLAVYMFGTTRELHHLLLASDALERDSSTASPAAPIVPPGDDVPASRGPQGAQLAPDAQHYYDLLVRKTCDEKVRTRVVVDVISGTSAGGINGVVLAKAIATNGPLEPIRNLWFEHADIRRLAAWKPWQLSAPWRVVVRRRPALTGDGWLLQLHRALREMEPEEDEDRMSPSAALLPPGGQLDLLVTGTDFWGSPRVVEIGDPPTSRERYHNHVFQFRHPPSPDDRVASLEGVDANAALAFAGRASASFPVAFPPVRIEDLLDLLAREKPPLTPPPDRDRLARWLFPNQIADGESDAAKNLYMIDGGVLDNYPLGLAFQRAAAPAAVPAQRLFLFLEPDPAALPPAGDRSPPNSWRTGWNAIARIPGAEPVAQDLREVARTNERIDRILDVIARDEQMARAELRTGEQATRELAGASGEAEPEPPTVAEQVEAVVRERTAHKSYDLGQSSLGALDLHTVAVLRAAIEEDAATAQPLVEEGYVRLRVHSVLDQLATKLATAVCRLPEGYRGPQDTLARAVVFEWARQGRLIGPSVSRDSRERFLRAWDLGYLRRNLRFVQEWIAQQYPPAVAADADGQPVAAPYRLQPRQIQAAHDTVRREIDELTAVLRAETLAQLVDPALLREVHGAFCVNPEDQSPADVAGRLVGDHKRLLDDFVAAVAPRLERTQQEVRARLYQQFEEQTAAWNNPEARQAVLARYLGFPYWDRLAYPYTAFSGTGDLARASVARLGPKDAEALDDRGAAKLAGAKLMHFGAFLDARGRQRDYLWGRLDGADRLSSLLGYPASAAFYHAILDEEPTVEAPIVEQLRACVDVPNGEACKAAQP